jgi:hypothetical protein
VYCHLSLKKTLFILLLLFTVSFSVESKAQTDELPFKAGERLHYKVAYHWKFVWINAGKVEFSVDSLMYNDKPAYHFKSFGRTLSGYDWFFKVRDNFESIADAETLSPFWFRRATREGRYWVNNEFGFDYRNRQIITQTENSNRPYRKTALPLTNGIMDVQTAVYYARSLDFAEMMPDEKIHFDLIIDGKVFGIYGRYFGLEDIENYDGQKYRCHKFSVLLVEGTIFSGGEDLFVWVTDDRNKIPILVEAKILVGSVKAWFTDGENLKYPTGALVD